MKVLAVVCLIALTTLVSARPQHQHQDSGYLQQYYAQIAESAGQRAAADATPIFEQNQHDEGPQYVAQGQQIKLKDNVVDQARQQVPYVAPELRARQFNIHAHQQQAQPQQQIQYVQQPQYKPAPKQTLVRRPQPQHQAQYQHQPQAQRLEKEEEEEEYSEPQSYQFGFDVKDDEFTNYQNRKEVKEGNKITGSYSVVDSDGFIRTVKYTADPKEGFKAEVIREPTDIVVKYPAPTQAPSKHAPASNHQYVQPQQPSVSAYKQKQAPQHQQQQQQYHQQPQYHQHEQQQQHEPQYQYQ